MCAGLYGHPVFAVG